MSNFSKQMVLKIAHQLEHIQEQSIKEYSFDYDDLSAKFKIISELRLTGKEILSSIVITRNENGQDKVFSGTALCENIPLHFKNKASEIIEIVNDRLCEDGKFAIKSTDQNTFNILYTCTRYFDEEELFDEDNETVTEATVNNIILEGITFFEVLSNSLYLVIENGYSVKKAIIENPLLSGLEDTEEQTSTSMEDLVREFLEIQERAINGDVKAQIEVAKTLQILYGDEDFDEDDPDMSPIYWYKQAAMQGSEEAIDYVLRYYQKN